MRHLSVCGPFQLFKTKGRLKDISASPGQVPVSAEGKWQDLKSLTVITLEPDYLAGISRVLGPDQAVSLLAVTRPQRLTAWPSALIDAVGHDDEHLYRLQTAYSNLGTDQKVYLDAIVPSLAAFSATLARLPNLQEIYFSDAVLVKSNVMHFRLIIQPSSQIPRRRSWDQRFLHVFGFICDTPWIARRIEQVAILLLDFWNIRPDFRDYLLDGYDL